jgi:hypothetical protein
MSEHYPDPLNKFFRSFDGFDVDDEWQEVTYQYVVRGLHPGSFFEALYCGDLFKAVNSSHPHNTWDAISNLCKWIQYVCPNDCKGGYYAVQYWTRISQEQRDATLTECHLKATPWEILSSKETVL